ncbi:hypothetical protein HPB47_028481 [Ixodes persulcatus]|uniref:Uncharacterized protein n=1 Tax=Ixodes persulcatus TaxID=34615 RepID=A0AC60PUV3_IXOPE|nr:hypothetical protein HPB47_028481 [Ixodes persulcatus]
MLVSKRDRFVFQLAAFGVSGVTASVNSITAANFEFSAPPPDALIILGDGATVQLSPGQSRLGKSELYSAFLGVPGVDSSLISREWFDNHYRWIVWKLASLEQHGPHVFAGRSALRKILERDDIAGGTLILCVSRISREENVPDELALRLNFNSTRRARWDAKLGYFRARQPFRVSLGSLHPKGGAVGRVDCIVIRAYPVTYLEMLSNKTAVMRSERAELVVAAKHDKLRSAFTEKLTAEVLSQVEKADTEDLSLETLSGVQRILTPDQLRLLNEYQDQQLNQKQLAIQQKLEQAFQHAEEEGKASQTRRTFSRGAST